MSDLSTTASAAQAAPQPITASGQRTGLYDRHIHAILSATLCLNLWDLMLTLAIVLSGLAIEANPVMADPLSASPLAFSIAKLTMVSAGVFVLWSNRHHLWARAGSIAVFTAYLCVGLYHVISIRLLLDAFLYA